MQKYLNVDGNIVVKVSKIIIEMSESSPSSSVIFKFLNRVHHDKDIDVLLKMFTNNIEILEKLYIMALSTHFDYEGKLLKRIVKVDPAFWNEYTNHIAKKGIDGSFYEKVFQKVWLSDKYYNMIKTAFDNILSDSHYFIGDSKMKLIFPDDIKKDYQIKIRQKEWIKDYVCRYYLYAEPIKKIFHVINTVFNSEKIEFYLLYLKCTKDIKSFKSLPLFPSFYSWSGSEVPLFDKKIAFLDELISKLQGLELIDHKAYLKEIVIRLEEGRKEIEFKEYLEENDFA